MHPPQKMNVRRHGGYTVRELKGPNAGGSLFVHQSRGVDASDGTLIAYNERSFYQLNNDVTLAEYALPGEKRPVLVWFDNTTGERIA